jgi:hypothetical protein
VVRDSVFSVAAAASSVVLPTASRQLLMPCGGEVSDFGESEGDNADVIEQGDDQRNKQPAMDSAIAGQSESGDATSAHSTGKMDPQAPGWTRR